MTKKYDDFMKALMYLRHFADKANVIGPIEITIRFNQPRDSHYFQTQLKLDCKELLYNFRPEFHHDMTHFDMCGIKVRIENDK